MDRRRLRARPRRPLARRISAAGRPRRALVSARPWGFLPAAGGQLLPPVAGVLLPGRVGTAFGTLRFGERVADRERRRGGSLAIALLLGELVRVRRVPPRAELAAGIALLVTTLGFPGRLRRGVQARVRLLDRRRLHRCHRRAGRCEPEPAAARRSTRSDRLVPCVSRSRSADLVGRALVLLRRAVRVLVRTLLLDHGRGALLALTLIRLWLERPPDTRRLVFVPAVIAVLATLDLVRAETITWGGGIVLGLCALLALSRLGRARARPGDAPGSRDPSGRPPL